jgi:hypothetical protein
LGRNRRGPVPLARRRRLVWSVLEQETRNTGSPAATPSSAVEWTRNAGACVTPFISQRLPISVQGDRSGRGGTRPAYSGDPRMVRTTRRMEQGPTDERQNKAGRLQAHRRPPCAVSSLACPAPGKRQEACILLVTKTEKQ